jgi:hypothetical protein
MYPVSEMCMILNVSRSGYDQWTRRKESERKKRRGVNFAPNELENLEEFKPIPCRRLGRRYIFC